MTKVFLNYVFSTASPIICVNKDIQHKKNVVTDEQMFVFIP